MNVKSDLYRNETIQCWIVDRHIFSIYEMSAYVTVWKQTGNILATEGNWVVWNVISVTKTEVRDLRLCTVTPAAANCIQLIFRNKIGNKVKDMSNDGLFVRYFKIRPLPCLV